MSATTGAPGFDDGAVFRSLFAANPDALVVVDLKGPICLANPAACDLLGYASDELEGLPVDVLVPDAIRPRHAAYRAAYAAHPRSRPMGTQMDLVAKRRDGSEVLVEIALSPLQEHGLPYVVAAIRGVAEYPRVKQALQRARYAECLARFGRLAVDARDLEVLLSQLATMVAEALQIEMVQVRLLEPNGTQMRIAAALGLAQEPVGQVVDIVPGGGAEQVLREARPVLIDRDAGGAALAIPARYLDAGATCELLVPLTDRERTLGMICAFATGRARFADDETRFLESISSMVATVLQRSGSEEALKHAQRLDSVGQLTGGIAHDFNNLLTVISGNLQILQENAAANADAVAAPMIGAALRATQRGAELTAKLLAFSRRQVLQPEVIDVGALLQSLAGMLQRTIDPRIVIQLKLEAGLHCLADPVQLESSLLNGAINARDAMPAGGTLVFECRAADAAELPPELAGQSGAQGYVAISMADTGAGMSQAVCERAFEPFFTTKESGRGTGLGLSTVYGFARQSRGAVRLQSAAGAGTTLTLYLPRVRADAAAAQGSGKASGGIPAGLRVLLVEDDPEVMEVARSFLASLQCEVRPCANAQDALHLLGEEAFDLLVSDVLLGPGMRGNELAAEALRRSPGLPVLLVSGYSGDLPGEGGDWLVLHKPYTRAELEAAMQRVLAANR